MLTPREVDLLVPELLPDGLESRAATAADRDAVVDLQGSAHAGPDGRDSQSIRRWQQDYFDRPHPTATLDDIMVVTEQRTGEVVASLMTVPQTWSYAGTRFTVGRPELAATRADYRGRGLMAHLLWRLSRRSSARGELVQALTDYLHLSEQIGYHAVLPQRSGRRGRIDDLPPAPQERGPVRLRRATVADVRFLARVSNGTRERVLLSCVRDEAAWRHEIVGRSAESMVHDDIFVVESFDGPVGFIVVGYGGIPTFPVPGWLPGQPCPDPVVSVSSFELLPDAPWFEVVPSALRQLNSATTHLPGAPFTEYALWLASTHPAYDVLSGLLTRRSEQVGWFLRVPDVSAYLGHIGPVLTQRLAGTSAANFSGDLKIDSDRESVRLVFEAGTITKVEPWPHHTRRTSDVSLPKTMLLQLIFGNGTWETLAPAYPDCRMQTRTASLLLPLLFPRCPSNVWPLI